MNALPPTVRPLDLGLGAPVDFYRDVDESKVGRDEVFVVTGRLRNGGMETGGGI
jgi:hypothetical protein